MLAVLDLTISQTDRYARYLADEVQCRHMRRVAEADYAADVFDWLRDRPAAVANVNNRGLYELEAVIIGRTAAAVDALAAKYAADHDGKLPQITPARPWHGGYRATVTRRESV